MLGLILIYVGLILLHNGIAGILNFDKKSFAFLNIVVGCIALFCQLIYLIFLIQNNATNTAFFAPAVALLFGITYLFAGFNSLFSWDTRPYGYFCLFVCINVLIVAYTDFVGYFGKVNVIGSLIWFAWAVLWFLGFIECSLKKNLGKTSSYLAILEGIFTAWIPGLLLLLGLWTW